MNGAHQGESVLAAAHADRSAALDGLYRTHWRDLTRYIAKRFGSGSPEPEEVAQAAFAKLAAVGDVNLLNDPRGYLYTIACNLAIDHQRRAGHRDAVHRDMSQIDTPPLSESSPERVLLAKERFALFEEALRAMPKMRRRIFLLVRAEGNSPRDVAHRFGLTEAAVYKHVQRALQDCAAAFARAESQG
ncbi:RNA polymerase sigma factor [Sphingomonas sp. dw_22]|uniref:RNA polymerase sigma factor n=1 Tax=Sphingomonas sp. dw_22 TaxID=2721175 RepID=UPI001BD54274|nr:RNA polymerase sigma factor [Sphingomonas sp. dw_22]